MTTVDSVSNITSASEAGKNRPNKRIEPLKAWRAVKALIADKEDTGQVFKVIDALAGNADSRMYDRFMGTDAGKRIVAENRDLIAVLNDRDRLKALPEGTLGREYFKFMDSEGLTADGLVEASEEAPRLYERQGAEKLFGDRMRDSHDLWHVTTGYGRDGLGELSQLALYYAQTKNRGIGLIVLMGAYTANKEAPGAGVWKAVREGYRLGKSANWFPAADWESMLELPLTEVRKIMGIAEPSIYKSIEPVTSALEGKIMGGEMSQAA